MLGKIPQAHRKRAESERRRRALRFAKIAPRGTAAVADTPVWEMGEETYQTSALGFLPEVVQQRGHVAEAFGSIFPVVRYESRNMSVITRGGAGETKDPHRQSCSFRFASW